ncbi:hypothetical protein HPB47_018831, partial [Ixodes persulcatus]
TPSDLAGVMAECLRDELCRRKLDVARSKEEIIHRLLDDIALSPTPHPSTLYLPNSAASAQGWQEASLLLTLDPAQSRQLLTSLLQKFLNVSQRAPAPLQIEELEGSQGLASWEPLTLLAVVLGKLSYPATNWKAVSRCQCFGDRLTRLQWQQKVTALEQSPGEGLVNYSLADLKLITKCPVVLTDAASQLQDQCPAISCLQNSEPLEGSMVQCAVVEADVPIIGEVVALPDSGSKLTMLSQELIETLSSLPWIKPHIAVVGGNTVAPAGTLYTRISIRPISAAVEVMVLEHNALPLILGEDWFEAAHAEIVSPLALTIPSTGVSNLSLSQMPTSPCGWTWQAMKDRPGQSVILQRYLAQTVSRATRQVPF